MCGIVGYIKKWKTSGFQTSEQKMFDQLLFADQLRGSDATGVIGVYKDGGFSIMKEASDAYGFAYTYKNSELDKNLYNKGVAVIGHNRAKTIGENKDENAHPFVEGETFAMVHNGTLRNHKSMHDTDVDSHALTILFKQAMDEKDWKASMETALGKVSGAFACVWFDQKRNTLCMIRNSERPLSLIETSMGTIFCSEANLGIWIAARNNEKIEKVTHLSVMTLYTFDLSKTGGEFSETFLSPKYQFQPTKGYQNGVTVYTGDLSKKNAAIDAVVKKSKEADSVGADSRGKLSKNGFKKLRASLIGRQISFWMEDYVDTVNDNLGNCEEALIMGVSTDGAYDLCEVLHTIQAIGELKPLGLKESDFYGSIKMRGRVFDVQYDKDLCAAIVKMDTLAVEEISHEIIH